MEQALINQIATYLLDAELEKKEVEKVTSAIKPDLTIEEGYIIQQEIVSRKLAQNYKMVGPKMGLTSKAKLVQMGIDEPIYGYVFDYMVIPNGGKVSLQQQIHPRVEAEIAFVMGEDVEGEHVTKEDVLKSTQYVIPALEIIDSRYENFNFTLPDVIADNASTSRVVFGTTVKKPEEVNLETLGAVLRINDEIKDLGAGAAVLGHPAEAIAMLAKMLAKKGGKIRKGDVILSGAITSAVFIELGDVVSGRFEDLGEVHFSVIK